MAGLKREHAGATSSGRPCCAAGACCCRGCARRLQQERHPWVNDAGLRARHAGAPAAAAVRCPSSRAPGVPGVPANPYGIYRLDSGDRVRVIVFGQDNLSRVYSVDTSGSISMPLIGPVARAGSRPSSSRLDIAAELRRKYIKDPKVSVEVEAYRPFFILGEVSKPGQFPYVNGMTVEAAVAIAEGYTERAKKRMVRLTRRFGGVNSTVMVPTDYPVQPGDTIYVLERFF